MIVKPQLIALILMVVATVSACNQTADTGNPLGLPPTGYQADASRGKSLFRAQCAKCHGLLLKGSDAGPPLLHPYYKPSHHADLAFYRAVATGVVQHHWQFGDMPPLLKVAPEQVADIVAFVRGEQRRVGID